MSKLRLFRPIILGFLIFMVVNAGVTAFLTFSPQYNQSINAKVDNILPGKLQQVRQQQPVDVMFLGTSQTNNGFATHAFETQLPEPVHSFNMGLPGTRYDVMLTYLEYHRKHYGLPRMIILEVNDSLAEEETFYYYLPSLQYRTLMENDPSLTAFIWQNPMMPFNVRKELMLSSLSGIYQFRSIFHPVSVEKKVVKTLRRFTPELETAKASVNELPAAEAEKQPGVGSLEIDDSMVAQGWSPKLVHPAMLTPEGSRENAQAAKRFYLDPLSDMSFNKLDILLAYCREHQVQVVLVHWPNHPEYTELFRQDRYYPEFQARIDSLTRKHGVPFIDLDQHKPADVTGLFADARHLSPQGAVLFSGMLARELMKVPTVRQALLPSREPLEIHQAKL